MARTSASVLGSSTSSDPGSPSLKSLADLRRNALGPPGWADLYRQVGRLAGLGPGRDVLDVGWGGVGPLELLAREFECRVSGVHPDPARADAAQSHFDRLDIAELVQVQQATLDSLPFKDGVFDVVVVGDLLASASDLDAAVRELARVTRSGGSVLLCQWAWQAPLSPAEQDTVAGHLGVSPRGPGEWRRILSASGIEAAFVEDLSAPRPGFGGPTVGRPLLSEFFSVRERLALIRPVLQRWGAEGLRTVLCNDRAVRRLLRRSAGVGLLAVKGIKQARVRPPAVQPSAPAGDLDLFREPRVNGAPKPPPPPASRARSPDPPPSPSPGPTVAPVEIQDLPLFSPAGEGP